MRARLATAVVLTTLAGCRALLSLDDLERVTCLECEDDALGPFDGGDAAVDQRPPIDDAPIDAAPIVCPQPMQRPQRFGTDLPDLIVVAAGADATSTARAGQPLTLVADVKNVGTQPTPEAIVVGVGFFHGPGSAPVTFSDTFARSLVPGATVRLYSNPSGYALPEGGTYAFTAVVDDIDRICEADDKNQRLAFQVVVAP